MQKAQKRDYSKFYVAKGDPGFSPAYNEYVINKTIKENEKLVKAKKEQYGEQIRERADAVASYLKSNAINSSKPIDQYLGKRTLAYLRGEQIVQRVQRLKNGQQVITIT